MKKQSLKNLAHKTPLWTSLISLLCSVSRVSQQRGVVWVVQSSPPCIMPNTRFIFNGLEGKEVYDYCLSLDPRITTWWNIYMASTSYHAMLVCWYCHVLSPPIFRKISSFAFLVFEVYQLSICLMNTMHTTTALSFLLCCNLCSLQPL